jgi:hypothetical protein
MTPYFGDARSNAPINRCLDILMANGATTLVIEKPYFDPDYRSEFSAYFSQLHDPVSSICHRLHFFGQPVEEHEIGDLEEDRDYLGYIVMRPVPLSPVSRAMLKPPPEIIDSIRASVTEEVSFYGNRLTVKGFPFTQQDTQLCRCAHSAAWMCHYAAYLRGDVARVPRAEFATQSNYSLNTSRMVPSSGLTVTQLSDLFRSFGLPAVFYMMGELPDDRLHWQPPPAQRPPPDATGRVPVAGAWDHGVIPILCRYLNSGLPVLIGTHDHAFVICGYRRSPTTPGWIDFYRNDDQRGPYVVVPDVLNDSGYTPWRTLHAPVCGRIWLSPEAAEVKGGQVLEAASANLAGPISKMYGAGVEPLGTLIANNKLALKTYVIRTNEFKMNLIGRGLPTDLVRAYRKSPMSRYIVVVEAIDRDLRNAGQACVIGQAIFDSTSADSLPNLLGFDVHGVSWPTFGNAEIHVMGPYRSGAVGPS